jgi:hypothetical protein
MKTIPQIGSIAEYPTTINIISCSPAQGRRYRGGGEGGGLVGVTPLPPQ